MSIYYYNKKFKDLSFDINGYFLPDFLEQKYVSGKLNGIKFRLLFIHKRQS